MTQNSETGLQAFLQDWWHFLIFIVTGAASFWLGAKRHQWKLERTIEDLAKLEDRLAKVEASGVAEQVSMAELSGGLKQVAENQTRILRAIEGLQRDKQDK